MLTGPLLHPEILAALARAGHGSTILIADGNFPASTTLGPNAQLVSLNLAPGVVSCTQVLAALANQVPIERAQVMGYARNGPHSLAADPPIWSEFRSLLLSAGADLALEEVERAEFYRYAAQPNVALTIATAERAIYANLLLTIGVRRDAAGQ